MYQGKTVAVVVPCYNEETQIAGVIATMPDFVDRIVVVNDGSRDKTLEVVKGIVDAGCKSGLHLPPIEEKTSDSPYDYADRMLAEKREAEMKFYPKHTIYNNTDHDRVVLIDQENSRKGGALSNGYRWCRERGIDCVATMDGDGQMDPGELEKLVAPVAAEGVDFVKGNRLAHPAAEFVIPKKRHFGNSMLSIMTKVASGYWSVSDSQTGYIVMSRHAIESIPIHKIYRDYGCPNDIMVKLNIAGCTIREITIKPVYNVGEKSTMQISKVAPKIFFLLVRDFFQRLWQKYFVKSFHPLFLFYVLGIVCFIVDFVLLIIMIVFWASPGLVVRMSLYVSFLLAMVFMVQSFGFAMFMDIQDNQKLQK